VIDISSKSRQEENKMKQKKWVMPETMDASSDSNSSSDLEEES
jgi:hypothetical protein